MMNAADVRAAARRAAIALADARAARAARAAAVAPPVCDCYVGKCPVDAGYGVPAGRACARYDGIYAA